MRAQSKQSLYLCARVIIVELRTGEMSRWMRCHIVWKGDILKTSDGPTQL